MAALQERPINISQSCGPDYAAIVESAQTLPVFKDKEEGIECSMGILTKEGSQAQIELTAALGRASQFSRVIVGFKDWDEKELRSRVRVYIGTERMNHVEFLDLTSPEGLATWRETYDRLSKKAA